MQVLELRAVGFSNRFYVSESNNLLAIIKNLAKLHVVDRTGAIFTSLHGMRVQV